MQDVPDGTGSACPRVLGTENETRNAAGEHCARAHCARLEGDDQRAVIEPPVAAGLPCRAQGYNLGMAGGVAADLADIAAAADDGPVPVHNHGANRHLGRPGASRRPRLGEGSSHRWLEASQITSHVSPRWSESTDGRVQRPLQRLAESDPPGQASQNLVGEQVEVTRERAQLHFVDAKVGED
jgi:hypothetical protein